MIRSAVASLFLLLAPLLVAQEPPPSFQAESQVVVLDVVASNGRGRVVTDLRADEIQVFEDGQACAIVSFRLVRGLSVDTRAAARPVTPTPSAPATGATATPARANLVVLLFDRLSVRNAAAARHGVLDCCRDASPRTPGSRSTRWPAPCTSSSPSRANPRSWWPRWRGPRAATRPDAWRSRRPRP